MPIVSLNLSDIKSFENLPLGEYEGEISEMKYQAPRVEGKDGQIKVTYQVIDGEFTDRIQSQWLSLSQKAQGRLKKWFDNFDLPEGTELRWDEETEEVLEPDLVGTHVIFEVYRERDRRVADENDEKAYSVKANVISVPNAGKKTSSGSRTVSKAPTRSLR